MRAISSLHLPTTAMIGAVAFVVGVATQIVARGALTAVARLRAARATSSRLAHIVVDMNEPGWRAIIWSGSPEDAAQLDPRISPAFGRHWIELV